MILLPLLDARGVTLLPDANLHPGAQCAYEHGFRNPQRLRGCQSLVISGIRLCGSHIP